MKEAALGRMASPSSKPIHFKARDRLLTLPEALGYPQFRLHLARSSMMIADVTPHSSGLN
jgi:hypothetical protein